MAEVPNNDIEDKKISAICACSLRSQHNANLPVRQAQGPEFIEGQMTCECRKLRIKN